MDEIFFKLKKAQKHEFHCLQDYRRSANEVEPPPIRWGGAIQLYRLVLYIIPNGYVKWTPHLIGGGVYFIYWPPVRYFSGRPNVALVQRTKNCEKEFEKRGEHCVLTPPLPLDLTEKINARRIKRLQMKTWYQNKKQNLINNRELSVKIGITWSEHMEGNCTYNRTSNRVKGYEWCRFETLGWKKTKQQKYLTFYDTVLFFVGEMFSFPESSRVRGFLLFSFFPTIHIFKFIVHASLVACIRWYQHRFLVCCSFLGPS